MRTEMARWAAAIVLSMGLLAWPSPGSADGPAPVTVTVLQLFDRGHRLEVAAGTEVVWADPHFDRVWLSAAGEAPRVERGAGGFRATFRTPGTYRGGFTVVGGHGTSDVYAMTVVVTPPVRPGG
jgi:hypothetical protein